jgi:hypothetical protein
MVAGLRGVPRGHQHRRKHRLYDTAQSLKPGRQVVQVLAKGPLGRFMRRIKSLD